MEDLDQYLRLEDLDRPAAPRQEPLRIQDPRSYFESSSRAGSHLDATTSGGARGSSRARGGRASLAEEVARVTVGDPRLPPGSTFQLQLDSKTALQVWNELAQAANLGDPAAMQRAVATGGGQQAAPASVAPALLEHLRKEAMVGNELLRQFWGCHPPGASAAKVAKCERVVTSLEAVYNTLEEEKNKLEPGQRHSVYQVTRPLLDAIHQAFSAHDETKAAA